MEFDEDEDDVDRNAKLVADANGGNANPDEIVDKSQAGGDNIEIPPVVIGEDGRVRSRSGMSGTSSAAARASASSDENAEDEGEPVPVGALEVDDKMQLAVVGLEDEDQIMMYRWCICAMVFGWVTLIAINVVHPHEERPRQKLFRSHLWW